MTDPHAGGSDADVTALLELGADGPHELLRLTDADLLALDGVDHPAVAPLLWLGRADRDRRELAAEVARRGLAARQLAGMGTSSSGEPVTFRDPRLHAVLAARSSADVIVVAEQQSSLGTSAVVVYVHGRHSAMTEEVDADGLHRFAASPVGDALTGLRDWASPPRELTGGDDTPRSFTPQEWQEQAAGLLGEARLVTVVAGVRRARGGVTQERLTVYALPDRTQVLHSPDDGHTLVLAGVSPDALHDRLAALAGR